MSWYKVLSLGGVFVLLKKSNLIAVWALGLGATPSAAVTQFAGNRHLYEFVATNLS